MLNFFGCVETFSRISRIIFSFGSDSKRGKKLAAVFIHSKIMCALVKLNCRKKSHAFRIGGGSLLVWKNRVSDLLPVKIITGFGAP